MRYKFHNKCLIDTRKHMLIKAFNGCKLTSEDNIKIIDTGAFSYLSEHSITLPESVEEIRDSAFSDCRKLYKIQLPKNLKILGPYAFCGCSSLLKITIPDRIKYLEKGLFKDCKSLFSVNFSDDLQGIGAYCFSNCRLLHLKQLPDTLERIDQFAFQNNNSSINIPHNTIVNCSAFDGWDSSQSIIHNNNKFINELITSSKKYNSCIGDYPLTAIKEKNGLLITGFWTMPNDNLIIPQEIHGLKVIGIADNAFKSSELKSVVIPNTLKYIGYNAFADCNNLESVKFQDESRLSAIQSKSFYNCRYLKTIIIPKSVSYVGDLAFSSYINHVLLEFKINTDKWSDNWIEEEKAIPKYKTEIKDKIHTNYYHEYQIEIKNESILIKKYYGNSKNLNIPATMVGLPVSAIGRTCFASNRKIENIIIPNSIEEIGEYAFWGCHKLKSINIPEKIKYISETAFCRCENLRNIHIDKNSKFYFGNEYANFLINPTTHTLIHGCADTIIPIKMGIERIGESAFQGNKNITEITIPEGVKIIEGYAFAMCENLNRIYLPETLTEVGHKAFAECINLETIESQGFTTWYDAFYKCRKLKSLKNICIRS